MSLFQKLSSATPFGRTTTRGTSFFSVCLKIRFASLYICVCVCVCDQYGIHVETAVQLFIFVCIYMYIYIAIALETWLVYTVSVFCFPVVIYH